MNEKCVNTPLIGIYLLDVDYINLKYYLLGKEKDIATEFEDCGNLRALFKAIIGRYPIS
jgi:hypothetical protein